MLLDKDPSELAPVSGECHNLQSAFDVTRLRAIYLQEAAPWACRRDIAGRNLPIGEIGLLHHRTSGRRDRESLLEIAGDLDVRRSVRYQADGTDNFCNIYASDFCYLAGCYLPRTWWKMPAWDRGSHWHELFEELPANDLFDWLVSYGRHFGWRPARDLTDLQERANAGNCGLIVGKTLDEDEHGHIAMVLPETGAERAVREEGAVVTPVQTQTEIGNAQGDGSACWWLGKSFGAYRFWYNDRHMARPARLRSGFAAGALSKLLWPSQRKAFDAQLAILCDEARKRNNIPSVMIDALIAGEDKRYRRHRGCDLIAICRAVFKTVTAGKKQGASTVEQQLVRTITGKRRKSVGRKVQEILFALHCSSAADKDALASAYLNIAYFGWRANGYEQARQRLDIVGIPDRETAAFLVASLRYPVPRCQTAGNPEMRQRRVEFILQRLDRGPSRQPGRALVPLTPPAQG
ncbi:biosynthetic peptidoglycan transglycosylase [Parasphingopyxis marina]|uniref:Transglycosylase domain-containing protein n=1 Tax=Parasphingopyxis marina TaxID=2761622 RepID=A0A842I1Q8_9SPHN|nr:biosynthetic peptidoglycan transglycosylase [Parasphingopyxis marina]MBC2778643.1 transglycosylase domain-containing protein [Parasphingopyxis marina]